MIVYEKPDTWRGTIEVYATHALPADNSWVNGNFVPEWRWRCKSNNGQIVGHGEGYRRRAGALNAIDAQYASRFVDASGVKFTATASMSQTESSDLAILPWRLIVRDRHGSIDTLGAVY